MKISINLLQETQQLQARLRRMGLALQSGSIIILLAFGAVVFFILSYTFWSDRQAARLSEDISEKKAAIELLRPLESRLLFVKQKLSYTGKVLGERGVRHELVTDLYAASTADVVVSDIAITEGADALSLSATTTDVFSLVKFLDQLLVFASERDITRISGGSFSRTENGNYMVEISLAFPIP